MNAILVSDVQFGTLGLNGDGSFTYTPDPFFSGTDSFTYKANDLANDSNVATVTISVTGVNDAPTATFTAPSYAATEQTTLTLHGTGLSVADPDAGNNDVTDMQANIRVLGHFLRCMPEFALFAVGCAQFTVIKVFLFQLATFQHQISVYIQPMHRLIGQS